MAENNIWWRNIWCRYTTSVGEKWCYNEIKLYALAVFLTCSLWCIWCTIHNAETTANVSTTWLPDECRYSDEWARPVVVGVNRTQMARPRLLKWSFDIYIYSIFIDIVIKMMMCAVCVLCMDSNSKPALLSVHSSKVHGTSLVLSPHGMCIIGFHLGLWLAIVCCTRASQLSPIATWQICRLDSISVKTVCTILIR